MDTSFIELPNMINVDPLKYYKSTREACYWSNDRSCSDEIISQFIENAKEYNYTEDQALALLMFNNFDLLKSEYDMHIYRPLKGLAKVDVKQLVKMISDGIAKTVKAREHRDFDDVHLMFPGYTVGDVLGAYSKHRFLIKKETYKMKKCVKKSTLKPYLTNGGLKEIESVSWNEWCSDTQFHLVYQKHYGIIQNHSQFQEFLSCDFSDMKHYNGNNVRLFDGHSDSEADGILNLLRKMNRKKSKPGSMFERSQLSNILSNAALERRSRMINIIAVNGDEARREKPIHELLSKLDSSDAEVKMNNREISVDSSLENKLYEYIKSDNNFLLRDDDSDGEEAVLSETLKALSEQHETVLASFKDYLPDPDIFQQLCHSWNNMDFAILLLGLSEFGTNFQKISDSIFTKSESMVASFYINHCSEFNLDEIVMQPCRNSELDPPHNDLGLDELIPSAKIKLEDTEADESPVTMTQSNESTTNRSRNSSNSKKSKTSKTAKKSSSKSKETKTSAKSTLEDKNPVFATMSLRSRLKTKLIMKSLIDEEIKSKNMKFNSKKNLKRKARNKSDNETKVEKRLKKTEERD